jgi:hypothetical protein
MSGEVNHGSGCAGSVQGAERRSSWPGSWARGIDIDLSKAFCEVIAQRFWSTQTTTRSNVESVTWRGPWSEKTTCSIPPDGQAHQARFRAPPCDNRRWADSDSGAAFMRGWRRGRIDLPGIRIVRGSVGRRSECVSRGRLLQSGGCFCERTTNSRARHCGLCIYAITPRSYRGLCQSSQHHDRGPPAANVCGSWQPHQDPQKRPRSLRFLQGHPDNTRVGPTIQMRRLTTAVQRPPAAGRIAGPCGCRVSPATRYRPVKGARRAP